MNDGRVQLWKPGCLPPQPHHIPAAQDMQLHESSQQLQVMRKGAGSGADLQCRGLQLSLMVRRCFSSAGFLHFIILRRSRQLVELI